MKSHELAKLLLSLNDEEISISYKEFDGHSYKEKGSSINSVIHKTPSGLFLNPSYTPNELMLPSDIPLIGTIRIFFKDQKIVSSSYGKKITVFNLPYENIVAWTSFGQYPESNIILISSDQYYEIDNYELQKNHIKQGCTEYKIEDIDYIDVLTEVDNDTWNEKYTPMSYDEAIEYRKQLSIKLKWE